MIHNLKPYPAYKDSGVPWLGKVPEHWKISKIRDVARVINGYPFDSSLFSTSTGYPLIRIRDLNKLQTAIRFDGPFVDTARVEPGEVLIGMDGDFNVGTWRGYEVGLLNQRMCCIRGDHPTTNRFLLYLLPAPLKRINEITRSTTVKHLASSQVERIQCGVPSEDEQSAIVRYLDHIDQRIRQYIHAKKKLIKLLEEQKQAIIHQAVTRGLDPNVKLKPSGVEWLGEIPEHWEVLPLKALSTVQSGITLGKQYLGQELVEFPYLRVANVQEGHVNLSEIKTIEVPAEEAKRSRLQKGDVLMTEGGDPDKLGRGCVWESQIYPCLHQNHIFAVRPNISRLKPYYLGILLSSQYAKEYFLRTGKQTTNLASTNKTTIGQFPIPLPKVEEQDLILDKVENELEGIERAMSGISREISILREYRTRLIADVVTGKLDVREAAANLPEETELTGIIDLEEDLEETNTQQEMIETGIQGEVDV